MSCVRTRFRGLYVPQRQRAPQKASAGHGRVLGRVLGTSGTPPSAPWGRQGHGRTSHPLPAAHHIPCHELFPLLRVPSPPHVLEAPSRTASPTFPERNGNWRGQGGGSACPPRPYSLQVLADLRGKLLFHSEQLICLLLPPVPAGCLPGAALCWGIWRSPLGFVSWCHAPPLSGSCQTNAPLAGCVTLPKRVTCRQFSPVTRAP